MTFYNGHVHLQSRVRLVLRKTCTSEILQRRLFYQELVHFQLKTIFSRSLDTLLFTKARVQLKARWSKCTATAGIDKNGRQSQVLHRISTHPSLPPSPVT